jgi:sulfate transport system substrate-binding protein
MYRTIKQGAYAQAQGKFIRSFGDGRIEIDTGKARLIGQAVETRRAVADIGARLLGKRGLRGGLVASVAALGLTLGPVGTGAAVAQDSVSILNVSYDPTRELYREYNAWFNEWWQAQGNTPVKVEQSHGGSGSQARAVIDGLEADVLTLAVASDVNAIAERTGRIDPDWRSEFPNESSPYTSVQVFLVRKGNPKNIQNWDDLVRDGVGVITPNPKTSGGARWNFLAAWGWAQKEFGGDEAKVRDYIGRFYKNVPVLDSGARGATNTFVRNGVGDILITYENEALLALQELGPDQFEIVVPSVSIEVKPPIAVVDENVDAHGTREVATAFLQQLYTPEAQRIAAKNFYRPSDPKVLAEFSDQYAEVETFSVSELFGSWTEAQKTYFAEGGVFDQIYQE